MGLSKVSNATSAIFHKISRMTMWNQQHLPFNSEKLNPTSRSRVKSENALRKLQMEYAGGLVKHLGQHMYAGVTPAIAELIANAWDADATEVHVTIPLDSGWSSLSTIVMRDNGHGMTFEECNERFLVVGRDRRIEGGDFSPTGRLVMGHKGLGKLGCFGIAKRISVKSVKEGFVTHFILDYDEILEHSKEKLVAPYEPKLIEDGTSDEPNGTVITLTRIVLERAVGRERFIRSMGQRFAVLQQPDFKVFINGQQLSRQDLDLEFRYPDNGLINESVDGFGSIDWWIGFTHKPIEYEGMEGIAVMVRKRMAQEPFFFDIKGGAWGQAGMRYMVGEVFAENLDKDALDLVATGRHKILWDHPIASSLHVWGEQKVRQLLREWAERRTEKRTRAFKETAKFRERVDKFPPRERNELLEAIDKIASIEDIAQNRFEEIVEFLLKAYENEHFMNLIRQLNAIDSNAQDEILKLLIEWDVLEAVHLAQIVRGRVEIIRRFREMVERRVPEKPDMQDFVKDHPWLIDLQWDTLKHEVSLDNIISQAFTESRQRSVKGRRRIDFFCLAGTGLSVVVELKRPGLKVGVGELRQLADYVDFLRQHLAQSNNPESITSVRGILVASELDPSAFNERDRLYSHNMLFRTWEELLRRAEQDHREYLSLVRSKAPEEDPRIKAIPLIDEIGGNALNNAHSVEEDSS